MSDVAIKLERNIEISAFLVKHRAEFSETCGYRIKGETKSIIYLPDIDNLSEQEIDFRKMIEENDRIYIDGTFYNEGEIGGVRDVKEIPHPFIEDSLKFFEKYSSEQRKKIFFIHLNHSNPCLKNDSFEKKVLEEKGYNIATQFDLIQI